MWRTGFRVTALYVVLSWDMVTWGASQTSSVNHSHVDLVGGVGTQCVARPAGIVGRSLGSRVLPHVLVVLVQRSS